MARIRSIKPEFWTDEKVVELSPLARLLFIGLWNFADDEGRMVYSPKRIKLQILPADDCDITDLMAELEEKRIVLIYKVDDQEYLAIRNFSEHQKIDKRRASNLPEPRRIAPTPSESPRIPPMDQGVDQGMEGIKERTTCVGKPPQEPDVSPVIQTLPLREGGEFEVRQSLVAELEPLYPKVDIPATLAEMKGWLVLNVERRKTRRGVRKFIGSWLQSEQEKAVSRGV